jgi:hypothetical protein
MEQPPSEDFIVAANEKELEVRALWVEAWPVLVQDLAVVVVLGQRVPGPLRHRRNAHSTAAHRFDVQPIGLFSGTGAANRRA